jgi:fucose 4-O-acetylase-like acetyltransferase
MDTLRGIAIGLVILDHSGDLVQTNIGGLPVWIDTFDDAVAPFRMATLVFLSGMLLPASLRKRGWAYLGGKLRRIGWPYLVWSLIVITLLAVTTRITGRPIDWNLYPRTFNPFAPPTYLWYLYYLLLYYVIALVLRRVPWLVLSAGAVAVAVLITGPLPTYGRLFYLMALFFLGATAQEHLARWEALLRNWIFRAVVIVVAAVTLALAGGGVSVRYQPQYLWGAFAGICLLMLISQAMAHTRPGRFLAQNGQRSIVYYCTHWSAILIAYHLADRLGVHDPLLLFVVTLIAGAGSGYVMLKVVARWRAVDWLYEWNPPRSKRPVPVAVQAEPGATAETRNR